MLLCSSRKPAGRVQWHISTGGSAGIAVGDDAESFPFHNASDCWLNNNLVPCAQLRAEAFEAAMAADESAAEAARRAALAEMLLLWGGPLMRLRPLAQAAELAAGGRLERLAKGTELPPSAGGTAPAL